MANGYRLPAIGFVVLVATSAQAHRGETIRALRLQAAEGGFEGLLSLSVPPGLEAQALLAPPGLVPGERPEMPRGELLGRRAALAALRGLRVSIGADEESLQLVKIELLEAKARATQTNGLEGMALIKLAAALPAVLQIDAPSGPRLRMTMSTPRGYALSLLSGVGREAAGGLSLRPRPGKPCLIRIIKAK